jgi:hypothetical protein
VPGGPLIGCSPQGAARLCILYLFLEIRFNSHARLGPWLCNPCHLMKRRDSRTEWCVGKFYSRWVVETLDKLLAQP